MISDAPFIKLAVSLYHLPTMSFPEDSGEGSTHTPSNPIVVPHKLEGLFVGPGNVLYTKNLVPGKALDDEVLIHAQNSDGIETDYTEWNPLKSKLAAAILRGAHNIGIKPGSHVLCLGHECGTTISHISNLVGPDGLVYVVGSKNRQTVEYLAKKRSNIISIIEDPSITWKFRMLVDMVDVIVATVTDDHEACSASLNAKYFLKANGYYVICVKARRSDPVFACLGAKRQSEFRPLQQISLEPHYMHHGFIVGHFRRLEA